MVLSFNELSQINGGAVTATFFNAIARVSKTIYDIGYAFGSAVSRLISGKYCRI